jgi:uncharacterized 2Fe-2S/4Fe-4S cluster protein (DUF4445 family)
LSPSTEPKVALPIDQRIAQRKILRHAHQRVVDRHVAVRVIFTHHLADDARAFDVRPVPDVVGFVHREQHASMHGFQPIAYVRQRSTDDDAHRVIEVRMAHFRL